MQSNIHTVTPQLKSSECSYCYRSDCRPCSSWVRRHRWVHSWTCWITWHGLLPWVSCWNAWIAHRLLGRRWCGLAWHRAAPVSRVSWHSGGGISSRRSVPSVRGLLSWRGLPKATWRNWWITPRCGRIHALWKICPSKGSCQVGCLQWQQ